MIIAYGWNSATRVTSCCDAVLGARPVLRFIFPSVQSPNAAAAVYESEEPTLSAEELHRAYRAAMKAGIPIYDVEMTSRLLEADHDPASARAMALRLQALAALLLDGDLPGAALGRWNGRWIKISSDVWRVATTQPLLMKDGVATFDAEAFLGRLNRRT